MKKIIILILITTIAACAAPINRKSSLNHTISAQAALSKGNWETARKHWAKAVVNAELGNANPQRLSALYYEYGRSLGVNCFFEKSETYLNKAKEIDKTNSGPIHMSLLELARLNYDQKKYTQSVSHFEQLLPIYNKHNAKAIDPTGVALVLNEYSSALNSIGKKDKASSFKKQATELAKSNKPSSTERTPYGTQCVK